MSRLDDLIQFYASLDELENRIGPRLLSQCHGGMPWPQRGVYFFFEQGEPRSNTGEGLRVVRVGTHAVSRGAGTTLWGRLRQHRGNLENGGGNHRGSVFRLLIGSAIQKNDQTFDCPHWGERPVIQEERGAEHQLEVAVSTYIRKMPFIYLEADDMPGPNSVRSYIERNSIALLNNFVENQPLDPPSLNWLGLGCPDERVRSSHLWNRQYIRDEYDPNFLNVLRNLVN